jgi:hypothetical protein
MNDFDRQGIPYFKIEQDCTPLDFLKKWISFCLENEYDMKTHTWQIGWLNEDFENFKITVVAQLKT